MNSVLSPLISEFDTSEQEERYLAWLNTKIEESLQDPRPNLPHDQVMSKMRALLTAVPVDAAH